MPSEYRCDGACRRILSEQSDGGNVDEGDRKYCSSDFRRLTAAREHFNATVQSLIDAAQIAFQRELGDFAQPALLQAQVLTSVTEKIISLQPDNVVAVEHGHTPPIRMPVVDQPVEITQP